jgi:hypothetical protein
MPRPKKTYQSKKKNNNNKLDTFDNNESSSPNSENNFDNPLPEAESPPSNFATTSNALPTSTDTFLNIPLRVKQYIDVVFEK